MINLIRRVNFIKKIAFLTLGIIFPLFMLGASIYNLHSTSNRLSLLNEQRSAVSEMQSIKALIKTPNDYSIFSMMYLEQQTHDALILKQIMKITSMYIGYAVLSIGVMMIFLGVETKSQSDINGNLIGLTFNVKSGSAGVIVFLFGAIMVLMPGVLGNSYKTPGIPSFNSNNIDTTVYSTPETQEYKSQILSIYQLCQTLPDDKRDTCFQQSIEDY